MTDDGKVLYPEARAELVCTRAIKDNLEPHTVEVALGNLESEAKGLALVDAFDLHLTGVGLHDINKAIAALMTLKECYAYTDETRTGTNPDERDHS